MTKYDIITNYTNHFQISDVLKGMARGFWLLILGLISKHKVNWPQFGVAESCELSAIGGKHQTEDNMWEVASWFPDGILDFMMRLKKSIWCIEFTVDSDQPGSIIGLPKELVRFKVEVRVVRGPGELLPNHRCQLAMMEDSSIEFFCLRVKCLLMKGNINLDWGLRPSSQPSAPLMLPECSPANWASTCHQLVPATSLGWKSGCPTILRRCWKLDCDFLSPSFQYHSLSKNKDSFGYGW